MLISKNYILFGLLVIPLLSSAQTQRVPSVKISAQHNIHSSAATTGNVTIISSQQIQQTGAYNLSQVLDSFAGIQAQDLYGDGSNVSLSMAGFGSNSLSNIKILVNGMPLNNPDMGNVDLNSLDLHNVERIEIYHGSAAIIYGDGAVGGVINIITKQPTTFAGHIGIQGGDYNQRGVSAKVGQQLGRWQYYLSGRLQHNNGFRDFNRSNNKNFNSQITYNLPKGSITVSAQQVEEKQQYPGSLTEQQFQTDPSQRGVGFGDFNSIDRIIGIHTLHHLDQHWFLDTHFWARHLQGYGEINSGFTEQRAVSSAEPQLVGIYNMTNGQLVSTSGIYFERDLYETSFSNNQDRRDVQAVYSQLVAPIASQWQLITGIRYAKAKSQIDSSIRSDGNNDYAFITSLGLSWKITPGFRWFIRRAGNYRFPKLDEADSLPLGSSNLKTQTGVMYQTGIADTWRKLTSRLDAYQLNLKNEIAYNPIPIPNSPFGQNTNLDPTRRKGLILTESLQVIKSLQLGAEYAYTQGKFSEGQFNGKRIPLVAENKFTTYSLLSFAQHWSWYFATIYVGNRYAGGDNANTLGLLGGTTVFNTNINYSFKDFNLSLRLNNITNKQYVSSAYVNTLNQKGLYPAPGRNFLLGIDYEF